MEFWKSFGNPHRTASIFVDSENRNYGPRIGANRYLIRFWEAPASRIFNRLRVNRVLLRRYFKSATPYFDHKVSRTAQTSTDNSSCELRFTRVITQLQFRIFQEAPELVPQGKHVVAGLGQRAPRQCRRACAFDLLPYLIQERS